LGEYRQLWSLDEDGEDEAPTELLDTALAKATAVWLDDLADSDRYDAIFVDEGQDFREEWWKALMKALTPDGEMLICADRAQNIYGVAQSWLDKPTVGTRLANPKEFKISYRMPGSLCRLAA